LKQGPQLPASFSVGFQIHPLKFDRLHGADTDAVFDHQAGELGPID
jgi:hypothetical protein